MGTESGASANERYESVSCAASLMVACEPLLRRLGNEECVSEKRERIIVSSSCV